ncbi:Peroxidase [Mycena venus]|uniref:Peroxidase n=1 Tax=Mycena venus TaxID=2733690 RepID=A0A8H7CIX8_9AGAR|nr:Peroxidase [Mycena venus]
MSVDPHVVLSAFICQILRNWVAKMLALGTLLVSLGTASAYIWPSPQLDALEALRWDQDGHRNQPFSIFIEPCSRDLFAPRGTPSGRADSADWIRTAYHDMATYNVADGTGGMDASIRFTEEQARAENAGDGFAHTLSVLDGGVSRYVSIADALAIGTVMAIENCGGPEIAFRGGRIDAGEPNTPGVPEPQQDLQQHIDSFARQGFTQTEMIGLVACGHTFGGVQHAPFPDIVPELNDPNNTLSVTHFDSTFAQFDNNVATEYISGTTKNPLVVGTNDTTNSDKRIFSSDGNATMLSFANSPQLFASTCADLFARMLDTVPRGVQLTEVITPLPVKPYSVQLVSVGEKLQLSGEVRFWNMATANRTVTLLYTDRLGASHILPTPLTASGTSSAIGGEVHSRVVRVQHHRVHGPHLWAEVDELRRGREGGGSGRGGSPIAGRFDVAVRTDANITRLFLQQDAHDSVNRPIIVETEIPRPAAPVAANTVYEIWSVDVGGGASVAYTLRAEIANGSENATASGQQSLLDLGNVLCAT